MNISPILEKLQENLHGPLLKEGFLLLEEVDLCLENAIGPNLDLVKTLKELLDIFKKKSLCDFCYIWTTGPELNPILVTSTGKKPAHQSIPPFTQKKVGGKPFLNPKKFPYCHPIFVGKKFIGYFGWAPSKKGSFSPEKERCELFGLIFIEFIDNFLHQFIEARIKHHTEKEISLALSHPNFTQAIIGASEILRKFVDFQNLVIFFHNDNTTDLSELNYFILRGKNKIFDPFRHFDKVTHHFIQTEGIKLLKGEANEVYNFLTAKKWHKEFLLSGIVQSRIVGAVIVGSVSSDFTLFEKELMEIFVSFIRQRVLDYNKEWYNLANYFSIKSRTRLLDTPGYRYSHLVPRTHEVSIIFADISGYTAICEKILKEPELIVQLVELWTKSCIAVLWQHQGTLDKIVGDCIIGIFGPPFFDETPDDQSKRACQCALDIQKTTMEALKRDETCFRKIREVNPDLTLECSIGVGFGKVSVGLVGQNNDYTCFGQAMNNTARIQGAAAKGKTLVFSQIREFASSAFKFGPSQKVLLKNVEHPFEVFELIEPFKTDEIKKTRETKKTKTTKETKEAKVKKGAGRLGKKS